MTKTKARTLVAVGFGFPFAFCLALVIILLQPDLFKLLFGILLVTAICVDFVHAKDKGKVPITLKLLTRRVER